MYKEEFPEYIDFLKYGAKLYRDGLLDPELFINSWDVNQTRVQEGRVGAYVTWPNDIQKMVAGVNAVISEARYNAFPIPKAPGVENTEYWHTGSMGSLVSLVNKNIADPERVMKYLNWQVTTEGWICACYGGPGVGEDDGMWHFGDDGTPKYNEAHVKAMMVEDPTFQGTCGGWVYYNVGRLVYHLDHQGFTNITESANPTRMEAREYNMPEVFLSTDYDKLQAMPQGPVELAKIEAVDKVFRDGVAKIVVEAKDDAQVESMYIQMIADAASAGNMEIMKERYERWQLYKAGQLVD
jgi:ABC-type glycerol-3-phosphate transport system substrate-binding protein